MADTPKNIKERAIASLNGQGQLEECMLAHDAGGSASKGQLVAAFTQIRDLAEYVEQLEARLAQPK